jgi:hypothetical protein
VYPSFYYPGAEFNFISVDDIVSHATCKRSLQKMDGVPVGVTLSYSIPQGLFQCIDDSSVPGLAWTTASDPQPL